MYAFCNVMAVLEIVKLRCILLDKHSLFSVFIRPVMENESDDWNRRRISRKFLVNKGRNWRWCRPIA